MEYADPNLPVYYCTVENCGVAMVEGGRKLCPHPIEGYKLRPYLKNKKQEEAKDGPRDTGNE